jgi:hypothetical protein
MHLAHYLVLMHRAETALEQAYREVADAHADEPDVHQICGRLAQQCAQHTSRLQPFADRYREHAPDEPERLHGQLFTGARGGPLGLLRDLQDLYLMACQSDICWTVIGQAAQGARDNDLLTLVHDSEAQTALQLAWLRTRMKQAAPQALVVSA